MIHRLYRSATVQRHFLQYILRIQGGSIPWPGSDLEQSGGVGEGAL